ncbi:hypothetical protein Tco_0542144 [Tanacetum coccineum]
MTDVEACNLLEITELPNNPEHPVLPKPKIPNLPKSTFPEISKPTHPELPKPELPTLPIPEVPKVLEIHDLPKPVLPTSPELPKDFLVLVLDWAARCCIWTVAI